MTLKQARQSLGLSQEGLGAAVGVTGRAIRYFEAHEAGKAGKPTPLAVQLAVSHLLGQKS